MRLRIIRPPTADDLDGIRLSRYRLGFVYDIPTVIANVMLAERWAEPVDDERAITMVLRPPVNRVVLHVEDDEDMRTIVQDVLTLKGFPTIAARNGLEALDRLRRQTPALVLLDLLMPIMDGWEFRQHQLSDPAVAAIPVVLLTAVPDAQEHARLLGVRDVIEKPITNFDGLIDAVRHGLAR